MSMIPLTPQPLGVLPDIPKSVIADLIGRFLMNIPMEEQTDLIRVCFQVELAHWLFVDRYCTKPDATLKHLAHVPYSSFAAAIFRNTPSLKKHEPFIEFIVNNFRAYKQKVPTFGAILLNSELTEVLLVQGFGSSWGFPKGKINQGEDVLVCAQREVMEETGYDITHLLHPRHFIENFSRDRKERMYLVVGADKEFDFKPNTLYEIKQIAWFELDELPEHKKDNVKSERGYNNANFFTIYPYVKRLKKWVSDKLNGTNEVPNFRCVGPIDWQFPYPYPMGFSGTQIFSPEHYDPISSTRAERSLDVEFNLNVTDWTPKSDIRDMGFGVQIPIDGQGSGQIGTDPLSTTARNPKRRLFVEDIEGENFRELESTSYHDFFRGPGAPSWLNFKLDANEILSTFITRIGCR